MSKKPEGEKEKETAKVVVPVTDPTKTKTNDEKKQEKFEKQLALLDKKPDNKKDAVDVTLEDIKLRETLELLVTRITEVKAEAAGKPKAAAAGGDVQMRDASTPVFKDSKEAYAHALGVQKLALEGLRKEIRTSTTSMTSIPKPLKFLRPHYEPLKAYFEAMPAGENKTFLADILSVMAMTMAKEGTFESLKYKLLGSKEALGAWGHEYVRNLAGEVGKAWLKRVDAGESTTELLILVDEIIPFNFSHNAEVEAVDLLLEIDLIGKALQHVTEDTHERVAKYLLSCADFISDPDERVNLFRTAFNMFFDHKNLTMALRVAIRLEDKESITKVIKTCPDPLLSKQLGLILGSARLTVPGDDSEFNEVQGNVHLNANFLKLASDLDVKDAKTPEDIYKTHLLESSSKPRRPPPVDEKKAGADGKDSKTGTAATPAAPTVDNAKQNLANSFVNAFVNCGFGKDLLLTPENSDWLYKNKDNGMLSAAASLGMIMLWDVESGPSAIDKYMQSQQPFIKAGAVLATGMVSAGVTSEFDSALALLSEHVTSKDLNMRTSAIFGLGLAYAGTAREDVLEILTPLIVEGGQSIEVVALTCLSLGLIFCGTANDDLSGSMIEAFLDRSDTDLKDPAARLMCLGLGLLFLGKGESADVACAAIKAISHPIKVYLELTVETCAYAGSGSVLEVQKLLSILADHLEDDEKDPIKNMHQEVAVLGLAMVTMGEEIGTEMALRSLDHVLQYGEVNIRRAVPLALGLISVSNPRLTVMDTLSKLSHDADERVSQNAVLALGFLGAGTNNSRIAHMLRQLAGYYAKEPNHLFLVRIAQGLLHMGKGLMTLTPFHSDGLLMNKTAIAGLLAVMHSAFDMKSSILAKRHYMLYSLVTAVRPRCLVTVDEDLKSLPVSVRVGQRVDTAGQAGKPRTITGFQTHTTPVLLAAGERAELSDDKYVPMTSVLEGFVILKKNPNAPKEG